jgi:hypothetical protein
MTMTGGGMNNHYRTFNSKSAFEEMYPSGNHFKCDTGFGPGQLTCYAFYCKRHDKKPLRCVTRQAKRFTASGVSDASLPSGYVMTGGGLYNHYRKFDKKAQFEESRPNGNKWRGDMGQGWGDYTTYVTGCQGLTCKTVASKRGNNEKATCPNGYYVTGCGIYHHNRAWGKLGAFEEARPDGQGCRGDAGFGTGDMTVYARCCKADLNWKPPHEYKYVKTAFPKCPNMKCGSPKQTVSNQVVCKKVVDGSTVSDSRCKSEGHTKPKVDTKHCAATDPCPVKGYCNCGLTTYAKSNYARRRSSYHINTKNMAKPNTMGYTHLSRQWNGIGSIFLSSGCQKITVQDDDEEEVLLTTSGTKSRQDQVYHGSIKSLPYDLEDDVKGIRIFPKYGCVKHCATSNSYVCP